MLAPLNDSNKIKEIYNKNGMVGITGILSENEIKETINDIQNIIREESGLMNMEDFAFNKSETYDLANGCMNRYGTIGKKPLFSKILLRNRCHPNVRKAYSIVYDMDEKDLVCQHDRIGWMRPTIGPAAFWYRLGSEATAGSLNCRVISPYFSSRASSLPNMGPPGRSVAALEDGAEPALETFDPPRGVDELLLAGKERMATGANFQPKASVVGRAGLPFGAAGAGDRHGVVLRM